FWLSEGADARFAGELSRARICLERARSLATDTADKLLGAVAVEYAGIVLHAIGEYRESIECFRACANILRDVDSAAKEWALLSAGGSPEATSVINQTWLARALAIGGEFDEAIAIGREALTVADRIENPYAALQAALSLGDIHRQRGDWVRATEALERAARIMAEREFGLMTAW